MGPLAAASTRRPRAGLPLTTAASPPRPAPSRAAADHAAPLCPGSPERGGSCSLMLSPGEEGSLWPARLRQERESRGTPTRFLDPANTGPRGRSGGFWGARSHGAQSAGPHTRAQAHSSPCRVDFHVSHVSTLPSHFQPIPFTNSWNSGAKGRAHTRAGQAAVSRYRVWKSWAVSAPGTARNSDPRDKLLSQYQMRFLAEARTAVMNRTQEPLRRSRSPEPILGPGSFRVGN